jgi:SAM-dependent methyltransferase
MLSDRASRVRAAQAEHFNQVAEEYEETIPAHVMAHLTRRRVELARQLSPSGRVLDVGAGQGTLLAAMPAHYEKVAVDVSAGMLTRARERGIETHVASAADLPFATGSVDLAMSFAVLHHLVERDTVRAALVEMCRVVKPGGAVLIWDHNPLNPYWPILMARLPQDSGEERLVPARIVLDCVRAAGMEGVRLQRLTFVPEFTPRRILKRAAELERVLERVPVVRNLAAHNVVTARKPA